MIFTFHLSSIFVLALLGARVSARAGYMFTPYIMEDDSKITVATSMDQPPSMPTTPVQSTTTKPQKATLPYYQPIQTMPAYNILSKVKASNSKPTTQQLPTTTAAAIFTQEEFPRDLLEIAQQKLGLKSLDEVPSVTKLAELLGTNSAAETISYIRQLTATEQGVALMKAYIESSDYTDSVGSNDNELTIDNEEESSTTLFTTTTTQAPEINEFVSLATEKASKPGFFERIAAYLNIYNVLPQHKQMLEQELLRKRAQPLPTPYRSLAPMYVRSPLPYHYPIPLRPVVMNRTNFNAMRLYNRPSMVLPTKPKKSHVSPHINTMKTLSPVHIQQLARMANIPPKTLESFLERKPKLAELAAKVASFPVTQDTAGADMQLLAAVHKAIENDEDLKKLLNSTDTLK